MIDFLGEKNTLFLGMITSFALVAVLAVYTTLWFVKHNQKNFKSPLNVQLLRQPGETLQNKINELSIDIFGNILLAPIYGITGFVFCVSIIRSGNFLLFFLILSIFLISIVYVIRKAVLDSIERNKMRVGLEAERAIADGINRLIYNQNAVAFHDFQADGFNIDHILITEAGVFAFETKGRSKNTTKVGLKNIRYKAFRRRQYNEYGKTV